ncbi:hypothetical protein ADIWIN_2212 [Winogradskyella psychrotolerans RS-3]|uniref:Uncharacterized protein n=1 Tax=Winogradskyella psychrotolerans RS-3 TaxID=641526 RepID=S7X1H9_9FLAO|nr:hypothetical protein [Winogradskyella psychrotolerans]EPR72889.1 hypothetical protein ADIWIN_2212 [Winogradskyella psychrotolerans RS-3]
MPKKLVVICLINFLIAAVMGLALRFSFLESIGLNYRFLTHAHSHVAMLGWVYLMLFTLCVHYFIPNEPKIFNRLFWLTEFAVVGMMVSFPIQGYAAMSIAFSTLHIFCSYYFVYLIWKHLKTDSTVTEKLLKSSLLFMMISTIGVWCLGPAVSILGTTSAFYQIAIQFFLHFQFNGWFLIAVITVFFHLLKVENSKLFRQFFKLLIASTVLTFALPIQWFAPHISLPWINGVGVVLQVVALYKFLQLIKLNQHLVFKQEYKLVVYMYSFALVCFILKVLFQAVSILPEFSTVVYNHRNFVIGFIHLLMLGVVSGFLFAFILKSNLLIDSKTLNFGIYSFLLGFVLTEVLLLSQGIMFYFGTGILPHYYLLLFLFSILLPLGISVLLFTIIKHKNYATKTAKTT